MRSLKERVARIYYTHGLFCASHPYFIMCSVIALVFYICSPLIKLPLPGNPPLQFTSPLRDYKVPSRVPMNEKDREASDVRTPRWLIGMPAGYVQQIIVKGTVSPWDNKEMVPSDAFRGPLSKVFNILNDINNFKYSDRLGDYSVSDYCLHVSEPLSNKDLLPEYTCLIVSPASLWLNNPQSFKQDPDLIKTIYKQSQTMDSSPSIKDILFGIPWKNTGISRYFIRNRQRTISYAVTIISKTYDQNFTFSLKTRLEGLYPETLKNVNNTEIDYITHVHYKDFNYFVEYTPLLILYFVLLMYLYFSVSKIEMVKSKWGLAVSALATVIASLLLSVSICSFFGLSPTLNGGEILPYLVVLIGLENVLVITRSVVNTPVHLDVKIRVAQGLSKEGWSITKNLLAELSIIAVGFFTFVPDIQEFAAFALVGLLSDFFLQMLFFTPVLSIDIRRMELSDLTKQAPHSSSGSEAVDAGIYYEPLLRCPVMMSPQAPSAGRIHRSRSDPRLEQLRPSGSEPPSPPPSPSGRVDQVFFSPGPHGDNMFSPAIQLPKRLKFIDFWVSTRIFQRAIMVCTVIWIVLILYKTGLFGHLASSLEREYGPLSLGTTQQSIKPPYLSHHMDYNGEQQAKPPEEESTDWSVRHDNLLLWKHLSNKHWPMLFGYYNLSIAGRYISILPSIHLSFQITPDEAVSLRPQKGDSSFSKADEHGLPTLSKLEKPTESPYLEDEIVFPHRSLHYYPKSQLEFFITVCLAVLSVFLLTYFMIVLYQFCCSRNYSKKRSSWLKQGRKSRHSGYIRQMKEAVPILLKGHLQQIECLAVDGQMLISCCLGGQIKVWDSHNGDCVTTIQRQSATPPMMRKPCLGRNMDDSDADLYAEYHGDDSEWRERSGSQEQIHTRSRSSSNTFKFPNRQYFEEEPDLSGLIETDFKSILGRHSSASESCDTKSFSLTDNESSVSFSSIGGSLNDSFSSNSGFDFSRFQKAYEEKRNSVNENRHLVHRIRNNDDGDSLGRRDTDMDETSRIRSWSTGDTPLDALSADNSAPAVWSLTSKDNLIIAGCGNGRIEFWDGSIGTCKCFYEGSKIGVTALCFINNRVIAARLDGTIDFLDLETFQNPALISRSPKVHKRGHRRHGSNQSVKRMEMKSWDDIIHCTLLLSNHAHRQPINVLQCQGGRVVSGSQDHTLKVFRVEDCQCMYTLHGHTGIVTALYLDKGPPYCCASGSADGTLRLWDLATGTCLHTVNAHQGSVLSITCTLHMLISCGTDDRLCAWDRRKGHRLYQVPMTPGCCSDLSLLTSNIFVTGGQGCIVLWDLTKGEKLRTVPLGDLDNSVFVRQLHLVDGSVVICDYGSQMRIIQFPTVLEKAE